MVRYYTPWQLITINLTVFKRLMTRSATRKLIKIDKPNLRLSRNVPLDRKDVYLDAR